MKIGIDGSRAEGKKTGVGWYSYQFIKDLSLLLSNNKFKRDSFYIYSRRDLGFKDQKNLKFKKLKWPLKFIWTHIRLNWELIFNPVDVLFIPAASVPFLYFRKTIVVVHDLGFKRFPNVYSFWQRIYYNLVHFWNIKVANTIITPSNFTKKEILKFYNVKPEKIKVIPLGFNKDNFNNKQDSKKVLEKHNIEKPYFLYVGRIEKKKNIVNLVKSFKKFKKNNKKVSLVLVGKSGIGYKEINSIIKDDNFIKELGYVSNNDLIVLYKNALSFIFPSFYEGFGIPVLEAMANGLPVISSQSGSLKEVGGDIALYFNPDDNEKLSNLMEKVYKDDDLRENLKKRGLKRVKNYSWEKCSKEIIKTLKS